MKLNRTLLASAAAVALLTGGAFAADLPVRSAAPAPVYVAPVFTWTGFYIGVNAGYGGDRFQTTSEGGIFAATTSRTRVRSVRADSSAVVRSVTTTSSRTVS